MGKVNIEFFMPDRKITTDAMDGAPAIKINVQVNGIDVLRDGLGVIDTGANRTYIHERFVQGQTPDCQTDNSTGNGKVTTGVFTNAMVEIVGLNDPVPIVLYTTKIDRLDVLIGRDLLRYYRMVYDAPGNEYSLEKI